ncbi:hypothetical protein [Chitiniphilus eburneus]|uniref:Autotransporter outer membrane beta-barrel domain-containing protein n=1 Tax=Chitiniphilus eburneus TaxID=2571148 RepID=A0A4U0PUG6_9NEIS|nr:hypothetical protein [Chitiniphilus eburneus]TJZ72039.1 hypothetical protein FAZ21_12980 [Chitiniphilus eburneus]
MSKAYRDTRAVLSLALALACTQAGAEGTALGIDISTLGVGGELTQRINDQFNVRLNVNGLQLNHGDTIDNIRYDADIRLFTAGLIGDWIILDTRFRLSAGVFYNGNKADLTSQPTDGTYRINGITYNADDVGDLSGRVDFNRFSPYLGVGWGNPVAGNDNLSFTVDVGVLFQGAANLRLDAHCAPTLSPAQCQELTDDVEAERGKAEDDIKDYRFWPVVKAGLNYRF